MRVLYKDEFEYLLIDDPLSIFVRCEPFGILELIIVPRFNLTILNFVKDFLELIDASDSFLKEGTPQIFLCYF